MSNLNAALKYAEMGYAVFPCVPGQKRPATPNGFKDALTDTARIENYWARCPQANVAISTAGVLVVDVDPGGIWPPREHAMDLAGVPQTQTPRGGMHYWFRGDPAFRCTASKIAPHVDTRADGGYVLAPPSIVGGKRYTPIFDLVPIKELPPAPPWLVASLAVKTTPTLPAAPVVATEPGAKTLEGGRNAMLTSVAGRLRRMGLSEAEMLASLRVANQERCQPPLEAEELTTIARSVARYTPDPATEAAVFGAAKQRGEKPKLDRALLDVPGIMGAFTAWSLGSALYPQPEFTLATAMALMGTITGRKVRDQNNTRTNLYAVCVGKSGSGKNHPRSCLRALLTEAGPEAQRLDGPEDMSSGSAILATLRQEPTTLMMIDELGKVMKAAAAKNAPPHLVGIVADLLKLYSSSGSRFTGKAYADSERDKNMIIQPHLVILGSTTPASLYESLTTESVRDGLLSRLVIFESEEDDPEPRKTAWKSPPYELIDAVKDWVHWQPSEIPADPEPHTLPISPEADEALWAFLLACHAARKEASVREAWVRAHESAVKFSMLRACSRGRKSRIELEDATWGVALASHAAKSLEWRIERDVAEGEKDRASKKILAVIREAGSAGLSRRDLTRHTQAMRRPEREDALRDLLDAELVAETPVGRTCFFFAR